MLNQLQRRARRLARVSFNSVRKQRAEWMKRLAVVLVTCVCVPAQAATVTWTAVTDLNWATGTNWDSTVAPTANDDALLPTPIPNPNALPTPGTLTLAAGSLANSLTINDAYTLTGGDLTLSTGVDANSGNITVATGISAIINSTLAGTGPLAKLGDGTLDLGSANTFGAGLTLSAGTLRVGNDSALGTGTLTIGAAGTTLSSTSATARTLANNLLLNADATFGQVAGGTGALTFGGTVDLGGGTRIITNLSDVTFNGAISNGDLTKAGAGAMTLSGTNTYSGATLVNAGELRITTAAALGGTSGITVADTAALALYGGITVNKAITITGLGGNLGALRSNSGSNVWDGTVTLASDGARLGTGAAGASLTVNGVIDSGVNSYGLAIRASDSADVITLTGANTYLGGTSVVVGTLKLAGGNDRLPTGTTVTIGNPSNVLAATLDLNGTNQSIVGLVSSGTTMVNTLTNTNATASTLTLNNTASNLYTGIIAGNLALVKNGAGTQTITGTNTYSGNTTVSVGTLLASKAASLPGYNAIGRVSVATGATLGVRMGTAGEWTESEVNAMLAVAPAVFAAGSNLGIEATANVIYGSAIGGSQGLIKSGAGDLTLNAASTFSGGTRLLAGQIFANNNSALGTGTVTMDSGATLSRLVLGNGVNIANNYVINSGSPAAGRGVLEGPATGAATISGTITFNANMANGGHINGGTGLTIAGPMIQAGTATSINIREGVVTLANSVGNNYTALSIAANTTTLAVNDAIDVDATVSIATVANTTLNLNNFNQAVAGLAFGDAGNPTASGTINTGTGTLTLNGNVSSVANGSHIINGNLNLGAGTRTFNIADGTSNPDFRVNALISNGSITKTGAGTLDLGGANTYAGGTTLSAGTLRLGTSTALGTGALTIGAAGVTVSNNGAVPLSLANALAINNDVSFGQASGGTGPLTFTGAVDLGGGTPRTITTLNTTTFSGAVTNGALTKAGTGTLVLTGSNTFTGAVNVSAGALNAATAASLAGATDLTVAGGATFYFGSGSGTTLAPPTMTIGGATPANLVFALGTGYDKIDLGANPATVGAGGATISATAITGFGVGTYNVVAASAGLDGGPYALGVLPGGYTYSITSSATAVALNVLGTATAGAYYWRGDNGTSWAALGDGTNSNWTTDAAGTTDPGATPGSANPVIFSADNAGAAAIVTTLDGPYSVPSIKFLGNGTGAVAINAGIAGSLSLGSGGFEKERTAGLVSGNVPINLAANQVWNVNNVSTNAGVILTGPLSGSGTLTKKGNARLELNNQTSLVASTNTGDIFVREGEFLLRVAPMGAADGPVLNPAGSGDIYLDNPGSIFYIRYNGDNSATNRDYSFANDLIVNSPVTINLDRTSAGSNKNSVFPSLTINNTQLSVTQTNTYRLAISGNINLVGDSVINAGDLTNMITGKITDAGKVLTLNKIGGNTMNFLGTGNDYSGGTVVSGTGLLRVGTGFGTSVTNPTATLGTGPVIVSPGTRAAFLAATNIASGQTLNVVSTNTSLGSVEVGDDFLPTSALRALGSGLLQVGGNAQTGALDMSRLGDGTWRLTPSQVHGNGTIGVGATIAPGAGNLFRLGGTGANTLTVNAVNYLTGTAALDVGGQFINNTALGGTGTVVLTDTNTYSGATTVNRGSTLRFQKGGATGASLGTTSGINLFGTIIAESAGSNHGTFFNSSGTVIPVSLFGSSKLFLDNNAITTPGLNVDRWDNATPIAMNQLDFELRSRNVNAADVTTEDVGPISVANGNILRLTRSNAVAGHNLVLQADSLTRIGSATLELVRSTGTGAGFGGGQKFIIDTGAPTVTNGMVPAWIVNHTIKTHMTYGANGFADATYGVTNINSATDTSLVNTAAAALTADRSMYALKQTGALTGAFTATIGSGGLIADFASTSATNASNLRFNDGTNNVEGQIFIDDGDTLVQSGTITGAGFTKFGGGQLTITSTNTATLTTGTVSVNRGTLELQAAAALGTRPVTLTGGGTLNLRAAAATTFNNDLTVAQNQPVTTINVNRPASTGSNITLTIPTLTLAGVSNSLGQTLVVSGGNDYDLAVSGITAVTGNATFHTGSTNVDIFLNGAISTSTTNAVITKSGGQNLRITGTGSAAPGTRYVLNGGDLTLRDTAATGAAALTPLGAGANVTIQLNTGTLNLRSNQQDGTFGGTAAAVGGYAVNVSGNATINADRQTGTATDKRLRLGSLTIGSQTLTLSSGNSHYIAFNDTVTMNGSPTFNTTAPVPQFFGKVTGGQLIKQGGATLRLSAADNVNNYDGGSLVNQGWLYGFNAAGLGSGDVIVNPGGGVAVGKNTTIQLGQKAYLRSNSWALAMVGQNFGTSTAPSTMVPSLDFTRAPVGVYAAGTNNTTPLDMSDLFGAAVAGDDDWYLGAIAYNDTYYRADTFAASTTGNTYRLGGGGGNMQINRNNATPNTGIPGVNANNVLTNLGGGATPTSVTIGLPAQNLRGHQSSEVLIAGTQNYTGGSIVNRGASMHLASAATTTESGAGTGNIDLFGTLTLRTAGTLTNGSGGNVNTVTTHPGARILLDSNTSGIGMTAVIVSDRWGDSAPVSLNGARFDVNGKNTAGDIIETIGSVTFDRGSQLRVDRNYGGTAGPPVVPPSRVYLRVADLTRTGTGTLMLLQGDGLLPDQTTSDNAERFIVSGTAPTVTNGMVAPWFVDQFDHMHVTYNGAAAADTNTIGFQQVAYDKTITTGTYTAGTLLATDKVNVTTAALTLTDNPTIYALKTNQNILPSGANNTITVRSGGFIGTGGTTSANLVFNDGVSNIEALMYSGGTTILQGAITASQITKFGFSELQFDRATPGFTGPLVVNNGLVRALQLGAFTTGAITLNGGGSSTGDDASGPGMVYGANIASSEEQVYTHGDVTAWDNNRVIFIMGGSDRTQRAGNFILDSTAGASGLSVTQFRIENSRTRAKVGSITFNTSDAILNVANNSFGQGGASSVFAPGSLVGNAKTITKLGSGMLELSGLTTTLTNSTINIGQGALRVVDGASLGTNNIVNIEQGTALEIAAPSFAVTGTVLNQNWGSGERWNVEDARGTGNYTVPNGVNLQINTNLLPSTPRTITLDGGSLEGYLYNDSVAKAVFRILNSNVTLNLASSSFIGQNLNVGLNGSDAGVQGLYPDVNPAAGDVRGAILVVNGAITGASFDLTKIGKDAVVLAGTNTYRNTIVDQGILRLGKNDTLPTTGALTTRFSGLVDLNGFNQTVGNIGTNDAAASPGGVGVNYSGTITNSAYTINTLTVGDASNYTYSGDILGNINLVKQGTGETKIAGTNGYVGTTVVNAGVLYIASNAPAQLVSASTNVANNAGIVLPFGGTGRLDSAGVDAFRTTATLGTNLTIGFDVADTFSYTYTTLFPTATGLIKGNTGTLILPTASAYPKGISLRGGTTEFVAGALGGGTDVIGLQNSNIIRWTGVNTDNLSTRLSPLPANSTTTLDIGANNVNFTAALAGGAASNLTKLGTGTLTLGVSNTYTGTTTIQGPVVLGADQNLAGGLTFGSPAGSNIVASLDMSSANATFGGPFIVQTNTATANTVTIGAAKTLTVNGDMTLGVNTGAGRTTNLTLSGAGSFVVSNSAAAAKIQIGGATGGTNTNNATLDMSALGTFTANLPGATSLFRIADQNTASATISAIVKLAPTSTITVATLGVGDLTGEGGGTKSLQLGTGVNTINANTINIGETGGNRGSGQIIFQSPTLGSLVVRSQTGALSTANLVMINNTSGTGTQLTSNLLLAGHSADVSLNSVIMAARSGGSTQGADANITFDNGTFTTNSLAMVARTGTTYTTGSSSGTFTIGGGTATLGAVTMAVNTATNATASPGAATATLNVNGGTVSASFINMANAVVTGIAKTANATINVTGGSLTLAGNITRTNGGGTENTTITLNGGTLDMGGMSIGSAAAPIGSGTGALNFQAGTLKNVAELNGGANLTKTTAGTLTLAGVNAYTGQTLVNAGTLLVTSGAGNSLASPLITVANGAAFGVTDASLIAALAGTGGLTFGAVGTDATSLNLLATASLSTTNPVIDLTDPAASLTANGTVTVNLPGVTYTAPATYPLIRTNTNTIASAAPFVLGTLPGRISAANIDLDGTSKILQLNVTAINTNPIWEGNVVGGVWDVATTANWKIGTPASATQFLTGDSATFDDTATGVTAVTLNSTVSPTSLTFTNTTKNYTISGTGAIAGATGLTKSGTGTVTLATTNTYTGATAVNAGTLRVDGSIAASSGVTVAGSATFTAGATQLVKTLDLSAASSNASILAGAIRVLSVGDNTAASPLTLTGGKMDLNTSALIVDFTAGNEAANLTAMKTAIIAGRGTGVWDGTSGLTSTAAAAASTVYGVGYAPSSIATAAIAGVTPDADAVVARYTRLGDANLDGAVNFFDLTALAAAYGGAGEWYNGDFDYSGTINFFDLTALAANYGTGLPSEAIPGATPEFSADLAAAFASVPEPGAISLLGLAALALLKRRNRKAA